MLQKLLAKYSNRFLSKWVVLIFDVFVSMLMMIVATVLRHNFDYKLIDPNNLETHTFFTGLVYALGFLFTQSFAGIIRHTSINDAARIIRGAFFAFFGLMMLSTVYAVLGYQSAYAIPRSIIIVHFSLTIFALIGSRFFIKAIYRTALNSEKKVRKTRVLIYGAGASGLMTKSTLLQDIKRNWDVIGFIDDNPSKAKKSLEGIAVFTSSILNDSFITKNKVNELILSIQDLETDRKKEIVETGLGLNLKVKVVPAHEKWINGELSTKQLRSVQIEELLERDPINLNNENIKNELKGKTVLVTGAAGSIGSEIVRQILHYHPTKVILLDQAESPLYDLEQEIINSDLSIFKGLIECVVADVKDYLRIEKVFENYKPNILFHAAAYKHVPLMELNPYEAVLVNIFGTKILSDLSVEHGVEKFVMVSTDKAVNPTNVMGASKRVAEIYTQSLNKKKSTDFIATRFGNVLGSNGSVIPLFKSQIDKGGPITITHKDITRYFMTIPEACNLVLEAGSMGSGGEVFVFDMGQSVKIYDLALKMIKLSGLIVNKDIAIKVTGLRPGEKLYEELLNDSENTLPTHHEKIMKAQIDSVGFKKIKSQLEELSELIVEGDNYSLVRKLKEIVPEFISNNSEYSSLDKKEA